MSAFFSSVCGTPRMATRKEVDSMTQVLLLTGPFVNIRHRGRWPADGLCGCREDGPTRHDLILTRHGEKGTQNLTGASVDRQSLTSGGPRTADCSPLWRMDSHEVLLSQPKAR